MVDLLFFQRLNRRPKDGTYLQQLALSRVRKGREHFFILLHSQLTRCKKWWVLLRWREAKFKASVRRHRDSLWHWACPRRNDRAPLWRSDPWRCISAACCPWRECPPSKDKQNTAGTQIRFCEKWPFKVGTKPPNSKPTFIARTHFVYLFSHTKIIKK